MSYRPETRGNRLGFYGVPTPRSCCPTGHCRRTTCGERLHPDEVHKRIVPISVVISFAAPGIHRRTHGHGKHRGLVPYIFVLSFYLVFVLLMVMLLKTTGSFQGSPGPREGGNYLTIGQTPKDEFAIIANLPGFRLIGYEHQAIVPVVFFRIFPGVAPPGRAGNLCRRVKIPCPPAKG